MGVVVVPRGDVAEEARPTGKLLINARIKVADRFGKRLVDKRNQARPQRCHRARAADDHVAAVNSYLITGNGVGIGGDVGQPPADVMPDISRRRYVSAALPGWQCEELTDTAPRCASICTIIPDDLGLN